MLTRVVLPVLVVLGVLGVGGYAAWRSMEPVPDVWVMPVVSRPTQRLAGGNTSTSGLAATNGQAAASSGVPLTDSDIVALAAGWVEPDPYAVIVSTLAEGLVKDVLALEGQRVEAGDVVAHLDTADAALLVRRAEAERDAARAEVAWAEAQFAQDKSVLARATVERARAQLGAREIGVEQAALDLSRREIRSPVAGIVMSRLVEPGSHVGMGSGSMQATVGKGGGGMVGMPGMGGGNASRGDDMSGAIVRIFDPSKLLVRAEVGVADCAKVSPGMTVQMTTDAAPEVVFRAVVTRIVPAVDQVKNTIDVKATIESSDGVLRPGMQMRVKIFRVKASPVSAPISTPATQAVAPAPTGPAPTTTQAAPNNPSGGLRVMVPTRSIRDISGSRGRVYVVSTDKEGPNATVEARDITMVGEPELGYIEVQGSVRSGERVVARVLVDLKPRARVHVAGEISTSTN